MTRTWKSNGVEVRWFVTVLAIAAMIISTIGLAPRASAQEDGFEIIIPVDTVLRNVGVGSITVLQTREITESAQGQLCEVTGESRNQESVHPGNDLIVESGNTQSVLEGVEDVPLGTVEAQGQLVLGSTITVSLRMGEDDVFSAGIDVIIDCTEDVPPEISVVKTAGVESVPVPGDDVTFNVVISNPSDVEDVEITSIEDDVFGMLPGDADCQVGTVLAPATSCEFGFVGAVEGLVGDDHVNTVTVEGKDEEGNEVTDEDDATVTFTEVQDVVIVAVTVAGSCEYDDEGSPVGIIDVDLPDGVSQLDISRGGDPVATLSDSGRVTVALERSYGWTATAEDGFELAESSGSVFVSGDDCPEEVEDEEVLPFTGVDSTLLVLAALVLLSSGFVLVRLPRRNGEV